ncbi:MAG: hypothetical protein OQJ97_14625 [Rhodospirillales bacterium]|nr:hypothetical protein [Rhodospirillales bacterium]
MNSPADDPQEIAQYLIQQHGVREALLIAVEKAIAMQESGDNYGLSVWRDVKRELSAKAA